MSFTAAPKGVNDLQNIVDAFGDEPMEETKQLSPWHRRYAYARYFGSSDEEATRFADENPGYVPTIQ